jgi:hypothetical protein
VVISVSSNNNTRFIGQITFPPGTIPAGWMVKIRDANNDKDKLSEDKNDCDKDREEQKAASRPFSVRVFDSKGKKRKIEGLEDYILLQIWAQLEKKDLVSLFSPIFFLLCRLFSAPLAHISPFLHVFQDKTCIGFTESSLPVWKCLQQLKSHGSKDEDSFFLTTETDHLT